MGLFGARKSRKTPKKEIGGVALIDIGVESIAGAYAIFSNTEKPAILYITAVPLSGLSPEAPEFAIERALEVLGERLMREGGPILSRVLGTARVSDVLVSIDAPWQETTLKSASYETREPFVFTKSLAKEALGKLGERQGNHRIVDRSIVATLLNGYEVRDPYRKKANRASILHLTSSVEERAAGRIEETLRKLFVDATVRILSGNSLRFQSLHTIFPHERELLIVDASDAKTTLMLLRNGLPSALFEAPRTGRDGKEVKSLFEIFAKQFPLPQTIVVAGRESALEETREALRHSPKTHLLPLQKRHISQFIDFSHADLGLLLMALFYHSRSSELEDMHTEGA